MKDFHEETEFKNLDYDLADAEAMRSPYLKSEIDANLASGVGGETKRGLKSRHIQFL